jgi:hypothetical protein
LLNSQEEEAVAIQEIADKALNTSQQALDIAKNAINEQKNTR